MDLAAAGGIIARAKGAHCASSRSCQAVYYGIPLVHLPTGGAAGALQPHPLAAPIREVLRQLVAVLGGVPQAADAGVGIQGGRLRLPLLDDAGP